MRHISDHVSPEETVPCRFCGEQTRMTGTKECDNCHEVRARIRYMPGRILVAILKDAGHMGSHATYWLGWRDALDTLEAHLRDTGYWTQVAEWPPIRHIRNKAAR